MNKVIQLQVSKSVTPKNVFIIAQISQPTTTQFKLENYAITTTILESQLEINEFQGKKSKKRGPKSNPWGTSQV